MHPEFLLQSALPCAVTPTHFYPVVNLDLTQHIKAHFWEACLIAPTWCEKQYLVSGQTFWKGPEAKVVSKADITPSSCCVIKEETRLYWLEYHCMPLKEHLYWRKTRQLYKGAEGGERNLKLGGETHQTFIKTKTGTKPGILQDITDLL